MNEPRPGYFRPATPPKPFQGPWGVAIDLPTIGLYLKEWGAAPRTIGRDGRKFTRW